MPRAHKRSSRGKADRQMRLHMQTRKKKRQQADAIEKARQRAEALHDEMQRRNDEILQREMDE